RADCHRRAGAAAEATAATTTATAGVLDGLVGDAELPRCILGTRGRNDRDFRGAQKLKPVLDLVLIAGAHVQGLERLKVGPNHVDDALSATDAVVIYGCRIGGRSGPVELC